MGKRKNPAKKARNDSRGLLQKHVPNVRGEGRRPVITSIMVPMKVKERFESQGYVRGHGRLHHQ